MHGLGLVFIKSDGEADHFAVWHEAVVANGEANLPVLKVERTTAKLGGIAAVDPSSTIVWPFWGQSPH